MKLSAKITQSKAYKSASGFVLITVLLLLSILSVTAFVAVEQSQLTFKVNHARVAQVKARQVSENGRLKGVEELQFLLNNKYQNKQHFFTHNTIDRMRSDGLKHFLHLSNGDTEANIFLQTLPSRALKEGVSLSQHMAYAGVGSGLGSQGSFSSHYEIRSQGRAMDKGHYVDVWTASDFMFISK